MKHDKITQKRIHELAFRTINDLQLSILRTPELVYGGKPDKYKTMTIDKNTPIFLGDRNKSFYISDALATRIANELATLWAALWEKGFAAWNFKLYLQPDGTVMLCNYSRFGFRMTSGPRSIELPGRFQDPETGIDVPNLHYFFDNQCFPKNFGYLLALKGCEVPADCLQP